MIRPAPVRRALGDTPALIDYLTAQQVAAPLLIAPPGGFSVTETNAPTMTSANITYHGAITGGAAADWWQWLKDHQTAIIVTAAALFALALITQGKGGRRRR